MANMPMNMELIFAHQIGIEQLKNKTFDYFIAASGYENRCSYLIDTIGVDSRNKIVLAFDDKKDFLFRSKNDKIFADAGFTFIEESAGGKENLTGVLGNICREAFGNSNISILIDYSCMSKIWYAGILNYFISNEMNIGNLELYFSYTSAIFSEPMMPEAKVLLASPRGLLKANVRSNKPRALILGLGYEKFLTTNLLEKFEYRAIFAFYSDPAFDNRYAERVMKNNEKILKNLSQDNIYKYPIENLKETDAMLTSLTMKLRLDYQVAILPAGPKPFTLSSLILASRYPDIEVWTMESGQAPAAYNRNPTGEPMVCKLLFSNEEESFL
jgi:hypothetical protein